MNRKRQREISYLKLRKNENGYTILAQPAHAQRLAAHFQSRVVAFQRQGQGAGREEALEFSTREQGDHLEKLLQEWKESYVSGGGQFME
jgi:hypothetical protein